MRKVIRIFQVLCAFTIAITLYLEVAWELSIPVGVLSILTFELLYRIHLK